jgi:hypothetical protein
MTRRRLGGRTAARGAALVTGLILVAAGIKLLTMVWFSASGASAYADGSYRSAATAFDRLAVANVIEPWRVPFGRGAVLYRQGALEAAGNEFGEALELAPERCEIRFNLAVTMEAIGDSMIGDERAVEELQNEFPLELYRTALDVIGAGHCPVGDPEGAGARLEAARRRLIEKLGGEEAQLPQPDFGDDSGDENEQNESSTRSDTDELQERNQLGAQQRDDARELARQEDRAPRNDW